MEHQKKQQTYRHYLEKFVKEFMQIDIINVKGKFIFIDAKRRS